MGSIFNSTGFVHKVPYDKVNCLKRIKSEGIQKVCISSARFNYLSSYSFLDFSVQCANLLKKILVPEQAKTFWEKPLLTFISTRLYVSYHTVFWFEKACLFWNRDYWDISCVHAQHVVVKYESVFWEVAFEKDQFRDILEMKWIEKAIFSKSNLLWSFILAIKAKIYILSPLN